MPGMTDVRWKIIEAALALAARQGWSRVSLADIARESGQGLDNVAAEFPSKLAILTALNRHIDAQMVQGAFDEEGSVKDRLFELLMRRLDALAPHRAGVRAMLQGSVGVDPLASAVGLCALHRSMTLALEAAGVSGSGPFGRLRANALGAIYLRVLGLWLRDATNDRVMAELDKALSRAERLARTFGGRTSRTPPSSEDTAVESPG
jgi:AcrR family transcriptional regulator